MATAAAVLSDLARLGFDDREIVKAYQRTAGLEPDGIAGPLTQRKIAAALNVGKPPNPGFDESSFSRLQQLHPVLRPVIIAAREKTEFRILDSVRGKEAQELAFRKGTSNAHFGDSAHNYVPAVAADLFPAPYDWDNRQSFLDLYDIVGFFNPKNGKGKGLALSMKVPMRCGADWNMNNDWKDDGWDFPHYELHPWRNFATTLYKG